MPTLKLDLSIIKQNATEKSFQRGQEYMRSQAVRDLVWRDRVLQALVEGSGEGDSYYRVTVTFKPQTSTQIIQAANCSCPYDFGGWCKHIVAVLLTGIAESNIEERPSLAQILETLNLEQTRQILKKLVEKSPDLIDQIDYQVEISTASKSDSPESSPSKTSNQRPVIDPTPFRRQVSSLMRSALREIENEYCEEDPFANALDEVIEKAKGCIETGDSFRALVMLEAIAAGLGEYTDDIEEYGGEISNLVDSIDIIMAEAILWLELSSQEQKEWIAKVEETQDTLSAEFELSLAALRQGWQDSQVQSAVQGEMESDKNLGKDFRQLVFIRLRILEAREQFEQYLNLAKAVNYLAPYVNMLIQVGRLDEAIAAAENIQNEDEAFSIAKKLLEYGAEREALYIADRGLQLQEPDSRRYWVNNLATWTADLAERLGEVEICLRAKTIAFKLKPSTLEYHKIRDLAGSLSADKWQSIKADLLNHLTTENKFGDSEVKINIFLEEGMLEPAIAIADEHFCQPKSRLQVMKAVINFKPEWILSKAQSLAEDIINRGKADSYKDAIAWLEQMRNAYRVMQNEEEWLSYRSQLMNDHGRKRKLMELFKNKGL
jgi:uncharacterized Zn finger protein